MALCVNPSESERRKKAEQILAARERYTCDVASHGVSACRGQRWRDFNCDADCPGWAVFETDGSGAQPHMGFMVQACDECNAIAKLHHLPVLDDSYAKALPAAKREQRRMVDEYGATRPQVRRRDDLEDNGRSVFATKSWTDARDKLRSAAAGVRKNPPPPENYKALKHAIEELAKWAEHERHDRNAVEPWLRRTPGARNLNADRVMWLGEILRDVDRYVDDARISIDEKTKLRADTNYVRGTVDLYSRGRRGAARKRQEREADAVAASYVPGPLPPISPTGSPPTPSEVMRRNPGREAPAEAVDKYEEFHRYAPKSIGEFARGFKIPARMLKAGDAKWTTYRSPKVDPATLKKPRRPVNYIHEHDAGVEVYLPLNADAPELDGEPCDVPDEFRQVAALVKLGESLGFCYNVDGEEVEAEGAAPLPELYCTPDGRCLLVVQDKSEVLAMIWGGALGVFARGIDG